MSENQPMRQPVPDYEPDDLIDDEFLPEDDESYAIESDDPLAFDDDHMVRLGLTLDFGPGDLACNQDGVLSPAQIARLDTDLRKFYWSVIAALAVGAFILGLAGIISGQWALLVSALLGIGVAALPAALLNRERERLPRRAVPHATMRIGSFSLTMRRWGIKEEEKMPVDSSKPIFGPKHIYKVLRANQTYITYYAPVRTGRGYRLLSLEPIGDAPTKAKYKPKRKGGISSSGTV